MACFKPIKGYRCPNGRVTFNRKNSTGALAEVPCGQCIGCRLDYSQSWAIRCLHEASLTENTTGNAFITLTYNDKSLPQHGSLNPHHITNFFKRFRSEIAPKKLRYYHCGEYGDHDRRPHYHALIFGYDFPDKKLWSYGQSKDPLYRSTQLERLWPYGFAIIGELNYKSAAYVARYTIKKIRGPLLKVRDPDTDLLPYEKMDELTGVIHKLHPEYGTMSRRPGIGREWYEKYKDDVFPDDFCVHQGKRVRTPKYYRTLLETEDPDLAAELAGIRQAAADEHKADQTYERLAVREQCKTAQTANLRRSL